MAVREGADPANLRRDLKTSARRGQSAINVAGIPLAIVGAGGLGGMAGGGIANTASALGIPGLQQNMPIDPESYSSSNTQMARMGVPTMQYM